MELFFLALLIVLMATALGAGFPVAFALPGSAIMTIGIAGLAGVVFAGDSGAYFAHGDPIQWLDAGVTNLRGVYWQAERDTLIAIPLFIFMGIMLERSKIAEDLLVTMGQLFGPIPGGLGISVVVVGALLAATTGIVGATVVAMGLISLPVMLRANYSHSLATGTISASGTLGQIIPPSIVLIILADQLSNATDQGSAIRTADYKIGTGEATLPSQFDLTSTSAGDMFLGAFFPGLVLVGLYIVYILVLAVIRPKMVPATPFDGKYNFRFALRVLFVLVPPLALIFTVLGSIILGIATVNQAGAIGAVGALIMAGTRLTAGKRGAYMPVILALSAIIALIVLGNMHDINVKSIRNSEDAMFIALAGVAVAVFLLAILWSSWQVYRTDDTLKGVMLETAKTTSLVFIILLGAAMLTASFRAFGGEDLIRDFLSGLPGGFWPKFVVVMAVIFVLGFFLDFIEIAVVVVPIIAPILLADPSANITAVWLGVMIGVNMQTSFLTPPFGFALFYLRGVAPDSVKTLEIYRGVVPFICLQLVGLAIVGVFPPLVNYLPYRVSLTSETAPPPRNPRLQLCLEEHLFAQYDTRSAELQAQIAKASGLDVSYLPKRLQTKLREGFAAAETTFANVAKVRAAEAAVRAYEPAYRKLHQETRDLRLRRAVIAREIIKVRNRGDDGAPKAIAALEKQKADLLSQVPDGWKKSRRGYISLVKAEQKARRLYRRTVDDAYEPVVEVRKLIAATDALAAMEQPIRDLKAVIAKKPPAEAVLAIRDVARRLGAVAGASRIKSKLSKARRAMKKRSPKPKKAMAELEKAIKRFTTEIAWRRRAKAELAPGLEKYDRAIADTVGLRLQERLNSDQAGEIATCLSYHRDISLRF